MKVTKDIGFIPQDTTITVGDPVFMNIQNIPARVYGLLDSGRRVPMEVAENVSPSVLRLSGMSAGGRLRFRTDSDYIVFRADRSTVDQSAGSNISVEGCDIYDIVEGAYRFRGVICASQGAGKSYIEGRYRFREGDRSMKDLLIGLPLFSSLTNISIALREGSTLEAGSEYEDIPPIIFYGSSIVHGVGACRPGNTYPAIISRRMNRDYINLGFSGAAKAEPAIIDYIASLPMSIFVYDYDHNAPTVEYLQETHYAGYRRFRKTHPTTPVIMASRPDYYNVNTPREECEARRQTVLASYHRGLAEGDKNLYFVDGKIMYPADLREESTMDSCHPNDLGYTFMAKAFEAAIKEAESKLKK